MHSLLVLRGAAAALLCSIASASPLSLSSHIKRQGDKIGGSDQFWYDSTTFYLNDSPYQILGGQIDPQRVPREYWADRIKYAKSMGLNTIFSYLHWHGLEPEQDEWNWEGNNDIAAWVELVAAEGMTFVLRPGPYVCAEIDFGGFPYWLSKLDGIRLRQDSQAMNDQADKYLHAVGEKLAPYMVTEGGPILMVQLENEYGFYGDYSSSPGYLDAQFASIKDAFPNQIIYTNDGPTALPAGAIPGALAVTDGNSKDGFAWRNPPNVTESQMGPYMNGELYITWLDTADSNYAHRASDGDANGQNAKVEDLEWLITEGHNFNIYMFHGGTNWGFRNGAVDQQRTGNGDWFRSPVTTGYDYGSPLDESGRPSEIYSKIRDMISKYVSDIPDVPTAPAIAAIPTINLEPRQPLFNTPGSNPDLTQDRPAIFEDLDQAYGYVLYEHIVAKATSGALNILGPENDRESKSKDRALVYINGVRVAIIDNKYWDFYPRPEVSLEVDDILQILVENTGRVHNSYGMTNHPTKGLTEGVRIDGEEILGWNHYGLPLTGPASIDGDAPVLEVAENSVPLWYHGTFATPEGASADASGDTWLAINEGIRGVVFINGFNLGRYWIVGPQTQLYLPGAVLKADGSDNEILVMELEPDSSMDLSAEGQTERRWANAEDPDSVIPE